MDNISHRVKMRFIFRILKVYIVCDIKYIHTFLVGSFIVSPLSPIWIVSKLVGDRISLSESAAFINMLLNKIHIKTKKLLLQISVISTDLHGLFSLSATGNIFLFQTFQLEHSEFLFPFQHHHHRCISDRFSRL